MALYHSFAQLLASNLYVDFFFDFLINIITVSILCYGIYYKRYHKKDSTTLFMLFNIFIFSVIAILFSSTDKISLGFGFGLFAILSIITLRSEALGKIEMAYFFGSLSIAIINAIGLDTYTLLILVNAIIILGVWMVDSPTLLKGVSSMNITLDYIPEGIFDNQPKVIESLSTQFGIQVISYDVNTIDYVKDLVKMHINFHI